MSSGRTGIPRQREVMIPGDSPIEALLEFPETDELLGGVVVAHPHPLHGSTLQQPVVFHTAKACRRRGLATLRFNFRGVGRSGGTFSGFEEYRDVKSAAAFLRGELPAGAPVGLVGYSFGAVMASLAVLDGEQAAALTLIAFPMRWEEFMPVWFEEFGQYGGPVLSVCAEYDTIAPPEEVEAFLRGVGLDPTQIVIPGTDHFFGGVKQQYAEPIGDFMHASLDG